MVRTQQKRPNVLFFFTDQQRFDTTGVHGNPLGLTPNFDRIATRGTHFAQTFTCQPVCGPSRSCVQTGRFATSTGCYRNGIPLPADAKTLAHYYRDAGYDTAYIGKWHLADKDPVSRDMRGGYDTWLAANTLEFTSDAYRTTMFDEQENPVKLPGYRVDALADAAIRYIDNQSRKDSPFYLFLSFIEPHHQNHRDDYPGPDGYAERYTGRWTPPDLATLGGNSAQQLGGYWAMVKRIDEALGRVLDALRSLNILDETIVLFTSDHGCHFKTRNDEYKRSCHESSIRVPAAAIGPGFIGGGWFKNLVSLVDLAPTLLDSCGIKVPQTMQGRSLMPLLQGEHSDWHDEVFVQISETQVGRAIRTQRWKYAVRAPEHIGLDTPNSPIYVEDCLYDLYADPYELTNLVGYESHRELSDYLRERLTSLMQNAGEEIPVITPAPIIRSGQRIVLDEEIHQ